MERQSQTDEMQRKRPSSAHPSKTPKTSVLHWRNKLKRTVSQSGTVNTSYSVRIEWKKKRVRFAFNTPNKNTAASKAAKIYSFLIENGWDATLEKFKPESSRETHQQDSSLKNTVGDLIKINQKYSSARSQTQHTYCKAFRRVVSGVMELEGEATFQSRSECGNDEWRIQVDAIALDQLTPTCIQNWKQHFLAENSKTAKAKRQATTTVNSLIRNSKALFSKKMLPFLTQELDLPSPLPFEGVTMEKPPSPRYHSEIDAKDILKLAHDELKRRHPESYKILLLALVCGLRISEIDHLLWSAFDFHKSVLIIQDTEYHQLKSEDSAGEIDLSEDMKWAFTEYTERATGIFVIESKGTIERSSLSRAYRCKGHIQTLLKWLRANGVNTQKPIHTLRKEIGSIITSEEGIFAASRYLRHSDIRITSAIYADKKKKVIPSITDGLV